MAVKRALVLIQVGVAIAPPKTSTQNNLVKRKSVC